MPEKSLTKAQLDYKSLLQKVALVLLFAVGARALYKFAASVLAKQSSTSKNDLQTSNDSVRKSTEASNTSPSTQEKQPIDAIKSSQEEEKEDEKPTQPDDQSSGIGEEKDSDPTAPLGVEYNDSQPSNDLEIERAVLGEKKVSFRDDTPSTSGNPTPEPNDGNNSAMLGVDNHEATTPIPAVDDIEDVANKTPIIRPKKQ